MGLSELKDILWRTLNDESNRVLTFTHRDLDKQHRVKDEDEFDLGVEALNRKPGDDNDEEYFEEDWDDEEYDESEEDNHREEEW